MFDYRRIYDILYDIDGWLSYPPLNIDPLPPVFSIVASDYSGTVFYPFQNAVYDIEREILPID